jgi:predicted  nucleic acid-binding Zn-ribbon protein
MSGPLGLYRIQTIDTHIGQIQARLDAIRLILENSEELVAANQVVTSTETAHQTAAHKLRQAEAEVQAQQIKIAQSESSLYGGGIRNPKELQDLQNEIASLKKHLATLEDRQLEAMLAAENAESTAKQGRAAADVVRGRLASQGQDLGTEQAALQKDLARLNTEREAAAMALDTEVLAAYNRLREKCRGVAVTTLMDGSCAACGTTLTPAQQQSAHNTTQITYCPTCGRVLYAT